MSEQGRGLGKGLDALLGFRSGDPGAPGREHLVRLPVSALERGRFQPRKQFDEIKLQELADSIRAQGVVQPVVVRKVADDRYEIVAGERRWKAAQLAGLAEIPAVVRVIDDRTAMAVALVENIQRADLNPVEEGAALRRLIDECELTHETVAKTVGKSRAAVTNLLRVLELPQEVQDLMRSGGVTLGHAKVLLSADDSARAGLARRVAEDGLSVRQLERLIDVAPELRRAAKVKPPANSEAGAMSRKMSDLLGVSVQVRTYAGGKSRLMIQCASKQDLESLLSKLERLSGPD